MGRRGPWGVAAAASVAIHLIVLLWVARLPPLRPSTSTPKSPQLSFRLAPAPRPVIAPRPETPSATPPRPAPSPPLRTRRAAPKPIVPAEAPPLAETPPTGSKPTAPRPAVPALDLKVRQLPKLSPQDPLLAESPPPPGPSPLDEALSSLNPLRTPKVEPRPRAGGGLSLLGPKAELTVQPDGSVTHRNRGVIGWAKNPIDQDADVDRRGHGGGPYRMPEVAEGNFGIVQVQLSFDTFAMLFPSAWSMAEKREMFERTASLRRKLRDEDCSQRLKTAVVELKSDLQTLWSDPNLDVESKRALLFERWDECVEEGSSELQLAAMAARATIVAFVREKLPPSSPMAFSSAELHELNARRRSRRRFAPYPSRDPWRAGP